MINGKPIIPLPWSLSASRYTTKLKKYTSDYKKLMIYILLSLATLLYGYYQHMKLLQIEERYRSLEIMIEKLETELVTKSESTNHNLDILRGQLEIIDTSIDSDRKRNARINKVVNAVRAMVPEGMIMNHCSHSPTSGEIMRVASAVVDMSDRYAVPAPLILGVIRQESAFCSGAVSIAGARGYMQLMPDTAARVAADLGLPLTLWNGRDNIHMGTAYLGQMLMQFSGDADLALKAYYAGPHHVKRVLAGVSPAFYEDSIIYSKLVLNYREEFEKLGVL